jgi:nanoRNase/pAp phosphatase (c-di-AMP/oligoRNAs hydrolase)
MGRGVCIMIMLLAERLEKLIVVVKKNLEAGKAFNIVLNHIDPDSLACGFAFKHFLRRIGVTNSCIRILFVGEAGEEQNEMMIDRYGLIRHMLPLEEFFLKTNGNDVFVLVDSGNPNDGRLRSVSGKFQPTIVIDHHAASAPDETDESFIWMDRCGSCATMLFQLLKQTGNLVFSQENGDDMFVPVLLALGVYADTHNLLDANEEDVTAYTTLANLGSRQDLSRLIHIQESPAFVAAEDYARSHRYHDGLRLIACAGHIPGNKMVYVAKICNKMIGWRGVSLAVVFAVLSDKKIIFSIRCTDTSMHTPLSATLRREFGDSAGVKISDDGLLLEGGGHIHMQLNLLRNQSISDKFLEVITELMRDIFLCDELR